MLGNISVRIVSLEHHIVLLVPLVKSHDAVVLENFTDVSGALGVIPETTNELVVRIMLVLLPSLDFTIVIGVADTELISCVDFIADVVADNVVKSIHARQDCLEVFLCVSIGSAFLTCVGGRLGSASEVVEKLVSDFLKWWKATFEVNRVVLHPVVLKKLHKTYFVVVIEVNHLIFSHIFSLVSTPFADITGQGLVLGIGNLAVLGTCVHVGMVEFS